MSPCLQNVHDASTRLRFSKCFLSREQPSLVLLIPIYALNILKFQSLPKVPQPTFVLLCPSRVSLSLLFAIYPFSSSLKKVSPRPQKGSSPTRVSMPPFSQAYLPSHSPQHQCVSIQGMFG